MHSEIRFFPSKQFYEEKIRDDQSISERTLPSYLDHFKDHLNRIVFFDLLNSQESKSDTSKTNLDEAIFTAQLIELINGGSSSFELKSKLGVISPYKSQIRVVREQTGFKCSQCKTRRCGD